MEAVSPAAIRFAHSKMSAAFAADLVEAYLRVDPDNIEVFGSLSGFSIKTQNSTIAAFKLLNVDMNSQTDLPEKIFSNHIILRGLLGAGGYWQEALEIAQRHESLLQTLVEQQPTDVHSVSISRLLNSSYYLVYFCDQPQRWRTLENQSSNSVKKIFNSTPLTREETISTQPAIAPLSVSKSATCLTAWRRIRSAGLLDAYCSTTIAIALNSTAIFSATENFTTPCKSGM